MNQVIPFNFDGFPIEAILRDGEPWFVLNRVCRVLGLDNTSLAASRLPEDEKGSLSIAYPPHGLRETTIINEYGLYRLVLTSRRPEAERFKTWVVREVLPTIRRTGGYGQPVPKLNMRDLGQVQAVALQLVEINQELRDQLAEVNSQREADKPKVQFYDAYINSDGLYGLQNAGRALSQPPNKFVKFLREAGYLFEQGRVLVPYQKWIERGYFTVRPRSVDGENRAQTFVTQRGLAHLGEVLSPQSTLPFFDKPKGVA